MRFRRIVPARTSGELDAMAAAGQIVGDTLVAVRQAAQPGVTTAELDALAEDLIRSRGAIPSFLGYEGFPGSLCTSVNEVVVHGIPSTAVTLKAGDLVSIDCGAILDGWHGDSAWTFGIGTETSGTPDSEHDPWGDARHDVDRGLADRDRLLNIATREVLAAGIAAMVPGRRLTDISHALEEATHAASRRYGVTFGIVEDFGGHGIGREMHGDPFLPNEGKPGKGPRIVEGSVLAIEPMLSLGATSTHTLEDDWTVVTTDGARTSHWEHTVAATAAGPRILTARPSA